MRGFRDNQTNEGSNCMAPDQTHDGLKQRVMELEKKLGEMGRLNENLRVDNEKYRQLLENLNEVLYKLDRNGTVTFISENVEKIGGYLPENVIGRPFTDFVHPEDLADRAGMFLAILSGEDIVTKYRLLTRGGQAVWIRTNARPIFQGGEITGVQGILVDISDLKQAEATLRQSERKFRDIFDNSGEMILIHDANGLIREANAVTCQALGYTRDEILQLTLADLVSPEDPDKTGRAAEWSPPNGQSMITTAFRRKDGSEIPVEVICPGIEFEGEPCFLAVARDITERLEKETEYAQILDTSIDGFWVVDTAGRLLQTNPAGARMLGYTQEEMLNLTIDDINAVDTPEKTRERIEEIRSKGANRFETRHRRKDGTLIDVEISCSYMPHGGGRLFVFIRDVTERKQAEEEKAQLQRQFHQSQKLESIGRLAGGVAHDLNNLLSPILGYSEMLLKDADEASDSKKPLAHIVKAGESARALVRQLLAFSRKQMLESKPMDLNALINDFKELLNRTIRENISVQWDLAASLPPIKGDAGQIEQVVMNLAVNAQDAMPDGGKLWIATQEVTLDENYASQREGVTPGPYVLLTISDTGEGMSGKTLAKLFEPFFTTKEKDMGTGLGLSTSYGIVKQHGGNIWAYSEPGLGATFKVYLPVFQKSRQAGEPAPKNATTNELNGSETVLLAEDEEMVRDLVSSMLEQQGCRVLAAKDGKDALDMLNDRKKPVDLLLTDVIMPDMNGKELYEAVSRRCPGLKVIYMSGYTENVVAYHGVLDPDVHFIQKPFSIKDLTAKIREVLSG